MILLIAALLSYATLSTSSEEQVEPRSSIVQKAAYFATSTALGSASCLARVGWAMAQLTPWTQSIGNECLLFSELSTSLAQQLLTHMFDSSTTSRAISPYSTWHLNKKLLSELPARTDQERQLLQFLEKRWLAKSNGFYSTLINWLYPCFGIHLQVHPETSSCYSRNPAKATSQTYKKIVESWKQLLPHPWHFPLILTRPSNLKEYLPSYLNVAQGETTTMTATQLARYVHEAPSKVVLDLTDALPDHHDNQKQWLRAWHNYRVSLLQACYPHRLNLAKIICIQRVQKNGIGGVRILDLMPPCTQEHLHDLLNWIGSFGLTANRVELDRWFDHRECTPTGHSCFPSPTMRMTHEEFISRLRSFKSAWRSTHPQKALMVQATVRLLEGLFATLTTEECNDIVGYSLFKIAEQLQLLKEERETTPFFTTASHIEQIHIHLSALLEIYAPFHLEDFSHIYPTLLTSTPQDLQPLLSCSIHSAGMTSFIGIFKALEKTLGSKPHVLYGENTYFECIHSAAWIADATALEEATEEDWKKVDLILAQFNPVLRRVDLQTSEYRLESIEKSLRKALNRRAGEPLTLALDSTLDLMHSPRLGRLLQEFQQDIEKGALNIISYRSGIKFDLFGMDNYCGAPLFMIHNDAPHWTPFDALLTDPALLTDQLSLNWFCLAYQYAAPQLELYRNQICANTRALLNKPAVQLLMNKNGLYQVIPCDQEIDPTFIDFKIFGPLHQIRGAALGGGALFVKSLLRELPLFFRPSFGFYHPNFSMIFGKKTTTIRLTLGLDPGEVDILAECFERIAMLNN